MTWAYFSVSAMWSWRRPLLGEHVGEHVVGERLGEGDRCGDRGVVLGEADEAHLREDRPVEALEGGVGEGARQLSGAVGAEVEEDHRIPVDDARGRDDRGNDELVVHLRGVRGGDGGRRTVRGHAFAEHEGLPGRFDAVPSVVPIHGVVAAHDRRHPADTDAGQLGFERLDVPKATSRRRVAPVEEAVHGDVGRAAACRHLHERVEVLLVTVDAARRHEPHQVHATAGTRPHRRSPRQAPGSRRANRPRQPGRCA